MKVRNIAINTGGGDAPGLNAVIRAVVLSAHEQGIRCYGIREGFNGILEADRFPEGGFVELTPQSVRGITHLGGTILGTTNRGNPLKYPIQNEDGTIEHVDRGDEIIAALADHNIDALVSVGGDGSLKIANDLNKRGLRVIGVPKTIDNDLDQTMVTFGFHSAVAFATECIDRLHSTAEAHSRVMVVEVMGRYAGWIALYAGVAATADVILIPEIPYDPAIVAKKIERRRKAGAHFSIIVAAEGAFPSGGSMTFSHKTKLGGIGDKVAEELRELTGQETRAVVLGHLLRGGTPSAYDRLLALRFGAAAVRALMEGHGGVMVALDPPRVRYVKLEDAIGRMKSVPLDCDALLTGRALGINFGD